MMICCAVVWLSQSSDAVQVRYNTNWLSQNESTESTANVMVTSLSVSSMAVASSNTTSEAQL